MDIYDVAVVGGGPAGSIAARYAALHGARVALFEEHPSVGSPVACTGLLSVQAIRKCDLSPDDDSFVVNSVCGAFVYAPDGTCVPVDGKETRACVVLRKIFDRKLASMAADYGVDIFLKSHVNALKYKGNLRHLSVIRNGVPEEFGARVVIAADGPRAGISRMVGIPVPNRLLPGIQFEIPVRPRDMGFVELFVGSVAPGFFGWVVPVSENICRVGMAIEQQEECVRRYLEAFVRLLDTRYGKETGSALDFVVGSIPLGPASRTVADGIIVCGDAAGQVKPTSGGGIYTGAVCARIAGEVAARAALGGDVSASFLGEYERRWRKALETELKIGMKAHDFTGTLSDADWNELFRSLNNPRLLELIEEYGDMDHPSILLKKFLNPLNSRHLAGFMKAFVKTLF